MKNNFFKILGLVLSLGITISSLPRVSAGNGLSMPKVSDQEQRALEISAKHMKYAPVYAEDGGLAYFWAWNGYRWREDFNVFVAKYRNRSDNITSARTLSDSTHDSDWITSSQYGNAYTLESFEEIKDSDSTKYLLRIDT